MKKSIITFAFVLVAVLGLFFGFRWDHLRELNNYNKQIEIRDSLVIVKYKVQVYKNIELGNILVYPNNSRFNNRRLLDEFVFKKYGYYINHAIFSMNDKESYAKTIMDSVIFEKYGKDFYNKLLREYNNIEKDIPENKSLDGYYIVVDHDYTDNEKTKEYILGILKKRKLIPIQQNVNYPRKLIIDFVVTKTGDLTKTRILLKFNSKIDSIVVDNLNNLPFKWKPGSIDGVIVDFKNEIIFEFGPDPFYKKID
ncbi:MAG: hypothetical protein RIS29_191 [Bacteroidota bacterium]|jgi:hypothetical protein